MKLKKVKSRCFILVSLALLYPTAYAVEEIECTAKFVTNSPVQLKNKEEFDRCSETLINKNVEFVVIVAASSPSGSKKHNQQLSLERLQTATLLVNNKFPNAVIKKINVGPHKQWGETATITFVLKDENEEQQKAMILSKFNELQTELQNKENQIAALEEDKQKKLNDEKFSLEQYKKSEDDLENAKPNFRIAPRIGYDFIHKESGAQYLSLGAEAAWINRTYMFRPEVGAKIMASIPGVQPGNKEVKNVLNTYGFLGGGATVKGFVVSPRLLMGYESIKIADNHSSNYDGFGIGGEIRLGYEWNKGFSVFASYALTKRIQMIGVDLGVSF